MRSGLRPTDFREGSKQENDWFDSGVAARYSHEYYSPYSRGNRFYYIPYYSCTRVVTWPVTSAKRNIVRFAAVRFAIGFFFFPRARVKTILRRFYRRGPRPFVTKRAKNRVKPRVDG